MQTNKKHFKLFEEYVRKWLEKFGLHSWDVSIEHVKDGDKYLGWTNTSNFRDRSATICLSKDWGLTKVTDVDLSRVAFHEVCHVLFSDLHQIAGMRFGVTGDIIEKEVHAIIGVLETVLWQREYDSHKINLKGDQNAQRDHHTRDAG